VAKGYVIVTEAIHDREGMDTYAKAAMPSIAEHGAKVLVFDEDVQVLEGEWHGNRTLVLEFESVEQARAWYDSDAYTAARPLRQAASDSNVVIVSGL
jgi:uncharacterized protein (DUF1330 family)